MCVYRLVCLLVLAAAPAFAARFRVSTSPAVGADQKALELHSRRNDESHGDQLMVAWSQEQNSSIRRRRSQTDWEVSRKDVATNTSKELKPHPSLGVIRLDYFYEPAPGDIDHPDTYSYDVYFRIVPGLTFDMAKAGKMTDEVQERFLEAIDWLDKEKDVSGITGDCGFLMWFQPLARRRSTKPIFMSSLVQLPAVTLAYASHEKIAIVSASKKSILPMRQLIHDECGIDWPKEKRYIFVGAENVPHFGKEVELGKKVDIEKATPGIVNLALKVQAENPSLRAFVMECTELPPYSDAVRKATGLPVYDAITAADMFMAGMQDNTRFGEDTWQEAWDGKQEDYNYREDWKNQQDQYTNISDDQKDMTMNKEALFNAMKRGMNLMLKNGTFAQNALPQRTRN